MSRRFTIRKANESDNELIMHSPWNPIGKSTVHYKLVSLGAVLEQVSGWELAAHFGDASREIASLRSGVGLADLSSAPKWEIKGVDLGGFLRSITGGQIPDPGRALRVGSNCLIRVSPNHALFILDRENPDDTPVMSRAAGQEGCVHVTDRTCGLGSFLLCGPEAVSVLRKLSPMDFLELSFPDLSCRSGPMAAVQVLVVRRDRAELPGYEIFFNREYGEYLWDAVSEAGEEFRMRPFGVVAERLLAS